MYALYVCPLRCLCLICVVLANVRAPAVLALASLGPRTCCHTRAIFATLAVLLAVLALSPSFSARCLSLPAPRAAASAARVRRPTALNRPAKTQRKTPHRRGTGPEDGSG